MFKTGFVDDTGALGIAHKQFLDTVRRLAAGFGTAGTPGYTGTGTGTITGVDTSPATVTETWTITCTAAAVEGGTFSVVGSVSGAKADATVGVPYDNGLIAFTINDGATDFQIGDVFTIATTIGDMPSGDRWTVLRYKTDDPASHELILQGVGLSGTEEIFIGIRTYENVSADYYNLAVAVFTGYVAGNTWATQPGFKESGVPSHNQRIDYWLAINAQRIAFALKVGTPVYESAYIGKFLPYATPQQYPYPVACIGMLNGATATRYSDTTHSMGFKGSSTSYADKPNCQIRFIDGTWGQVECWPWSNWLIAGSVPNNSSYWQLRDTNNQFPVLPVVLNKNTPNVFGELDGIGYVSNFNNTVESTVGDGTTNWVCIQDVARTGFVDYFALRMD